MSNIREFIDLSNTIALISHTNPDSDNLGSLTALAESLRQFGKNVTAISIDPIPYNLKFLYGIDKLTQDWNGEYDLLISLDSSSLDRFGKAIDIVEHSKYKINIDHHITNNLNFDINIVKADYSSTGEVLYEVIKENDLPIDKNIGESLFTAISGDSGSFKYDSVTSRTFKYAAELTELGIDKNKINTNLYAKNKLAKIKVLSLIVERMKVVEDKKFIYSYILKEDLNRLNAEQADVEGSAEYLRDIDGMEVSLILKETDTGFKGSLRSKFDYDVSKLAMKFDGGGHKKAAGFNIDEKNLEITIEKILENYGQI